MQRDRIAVFVAIFLIGGVGFVATAGAEDEMVFGVDEVEEETDIEHLEEMLEEGQRLYEDGNFEEASLRFFDVLMDDAPGADSYHPEAEYELARTLFRLELYQGALRYFGQIAEEGDFHPYFQSALRGLLLLTDVIPGDMELAQHLARYADHFPEIVPDEYRDRYAYLAGRHFHDNYELEEAVRLLSEVGPSSDHYGSARYVLGVTHVADYEAEPAVEAFRDVLRHLEAKATPLDELRGADARLLDLTHLGMARVFYSTGDFGISLDYYDRIDRESPRWPEALFESSWTFFQVDDFNRALGNLHSLNSPFFEDAYFPEGPILASVIYFYNCNYDLVRETLDDFDYVYEEVFEEIAAVLDEHPDHFALHEWASEWRRGEIDGSPEFESALRASLDDRQVVQRFELIEAIDTEAEVMTEMADSWQSSELGEELQQEAALARSFAVEDAGELVERRLERTRDELRDLLGQHSEILFEVARAERGEIEADIRRGMEEMEVTETLDLEVSDEQMYWQFEGEYWQDELGFYHVDVRSECRR